MPSIVRLAQIAQIFVLVGASLTLSDVAQAQTVTHSPDAIADVIAIDILIQPGDATLHKARSINAQLRQNYPQGYALDAAHLPHITLVQRFIHANDLEAVKTAIEAVVKSQPLSSLQLTASGYTVSTWGDTGILLLNIDPTSQLKQLASKVIEAVQPYSVSGGTPEAFVRSPGEQIDPKTVQWVENFVPAHSGEHYEPHITLGLAHPDFLTKLKTAPFQPLTIHPAEIAIYQLGNVGTAQKKLAGWPAR